MKLALLYTALLTSMSVIIWLAARKAGRAEKELEHARQQVRDHECAGEILNNYINMSSEQLADSVRKHREACKERMHSKD